MKVLRNQWHVAAWSHELRGAAFVARTIATDPLLLMRTEDGVVTTIVDRCCHRHAPLSLGRREGDRIRCMYHGLLFDSDGRCVDVPGQKLVPSTLRVRSYPTVERDNWVWVWLGDAELADPAAIPATSSLGDPDWHYVPGYLHWDVDQQLVVDNLVDFSHLNFVHERTLGGGSIPETRPQVTRTENGVKIEWWQFSVEPSAFHMGIRPFPGLVDRWFRYEFTLPGILVMNSGVQDVGTGAADGLYHESLIELRSCQAIIPATDTTSHYFFANPHNLHDPDGTISQSIAKSVREAFAEDYQMIRAQQDRISTDRDTPMMALPFDTAVVLMRRLIDERLREEAQQLTNPIKAATNS